MKADTVTTAIVALYNVRSDLQENLIQAGFEGDMHTLEGIMRLDRAIAELEAERAGAQGIGLDAGCDATAEPRT